MNIAVLVSGGVDSSVALSLLKQQGHTITAFYLKIWLEDELSYLGTCPWEEDLEYVRAVCKQLEVPLEVISLQKEYWEEVVSYTVSEIKIGNTPNPDILCNQRVKFGAFYKKIDDSFTHVATGHYAKRVDAGSEVMLYRAPDLIKDQTYFLSHVTQKQLQRVLFPIGHLEKAEVRALAHQADLPNKARKDSQGICFLGKLKFSDFIKHHVGTRPGDLVEIETGKKVGAHEGFWFYTLGQRQGIGLSGGPWYVVAKDVEKNIVYISKQYYAEDKLRDTFTINNCNWINQSPTGAGLRVKIRHGAHMHDCTLESLNSDNLQYKVTLGMRDQAIAPGQFAVFYDGEQCLGGGVITQNI